MSRWQLISDSDNNIRWETLPTSDTPRRNDLPPPPPHPLPSFHPLLLHGCSKILEDINASINPIVDEDLPFFPTASPNNSSLPKPASFLPPHFYTGQPFAKGHEFSSPDTVLQRSLGKNSREHGFSSPSPGFSSPSSMFQTGSGKTVNVSSEGLLRAKALLGTDVNSNNCTFRGFEPLKKRCRSSDRPNNERWSNLECKSVDGESHALFTKVPCHSKNSVSGNEFLCEDIGELVQSEMCSSVKSSSTVKFNTAGGRSISVSSDALKRARSLLGRSEIDRYLDEEDAGVPTFPFFKHGNSDGNVLDKGNKTVPSLNWPQIARNEQNPKVFTSPMKQSLKLKQLEAKSERLVPGTNLISKFNAEESIIKSSGKPSCQPLQEKALFGNAATRHSMENGVTSGLQGPSKALRGPLVDITNIAIDSKSMLGTSTELQRLGRRTYVSPFKMPRVSKFVTPSNSTLSSVPDGFSSRSSETSCSRRKVSTRYPAQFSRVYIKDFFKGPPTYPQTEDLRHINPENSEKYTFCDGSQLIGAEAFYHMLVQSGASLQHMTKEWVENHCKWIVWKLASYERSYSLKFNKQFLTTSNVLEELKYRYEREINNGHRSAIKRILEGDASPSSMLVLCISAIQSNCEIIPSASVSVKSMARVELTDGWYSINAQLDPLLSKHLAAGKLFVGQKLRICGAGLTGWDGPVSPLEVSQTISLLVHINGAYRATWDERLGFCRGACTPLAFRCIKGNGGPVPRTLVGVKRIYPVLYRERLKSGGYIVRSEKMEAALTQLYSQRRSTIIEEITSDFQRGSSDSRIADEYDNEEGAKIFKMLENADEPELVMAEMSKEQLSSFSMYRTKVEENRHCNLQRSIEKALEDAGLSAREVSPFMRVRVVGLECKGHPGNRGTREGLVTIWNPTERQKLELAEGQAYAISGLIPLYCDSNTLYLQARGSTTEWRPLTAMEKIPFLPFFNPRKPICLSKLGEISMSSDFDTVVFVVHVGLEFVAGQQKKQWVFVTDGSLSEPQTEESTISLLAISFCSPCTDDDLMSPINYNLVGSIVGFCNLVKRPQDHMNRMWVAEATENSTYYLNHEHPSCSHLKNAFSLVKRWEQNSSLSIEKLKEKVTCIACGP